MILSSPDPAADPYVAAALLRLQRVAYAVEAELIGDDRISPLQQDEVGLTAFRGRWVVAWDGVDLLGAAAWSVTHDAIEVEKVMVHPSAHRRGVATALLDRVVTVPDRPVLTATGRDNTPALAFYRRLGFAHDGDEQVPPGIWVSRLRLSPARS